MIPQDSDWKEDMTTTEINQEDVLKALEQVEDPELKDNLVALNMIRDVEITNGNVRFKLILTTPACPYKTKIENDAKQAVTKLAGVTDVQITLSFEVPSDGRERKGFSHPIKNVVAIASGKGGVGKSTVAVNVAVYLAQCGARVGLLDADVYGPNIPTMMGVERLPPGSETKIQPAQAYGVKLMSIGFLVKPGQPIIWRGPMLHTAINQLLNDVEWGELDYLIVDLPPGTGDAQLSLAQSISVTGGVIVTLPQQVSLDDALRGLEMFRQLEIPILGVVENMSYLELPDGTTLDVFGSGGGIKLAGRTGVPYIGAIPMDSTVREGGDSGKPVILSAPDSPVSKAIIEIASSIASKISVAAIQSNDDIISIETIG